MKGVRCQSALNTSGRRPDRSGKKARSAAGADAKACIRSRVIGTEIRGLSSCGGGTSPKASGGSDDTFEFLGTARGNEHGAVVARSGQATGGPQTARYGL